MEKAINQPEYVRDLFEKDFINKWTCYIITPEKCYKKYKIDKEKIEELVCELSNKALGNDYVKNYWKKTKGLSEEEKELAYEQWVNNRKKLIEHLKTHKYYVKQNKAKYYFIDFLEQVLYRIAEVEIREFYTDKDVHLQYYENFNVSLDAGYKKEYKKEIVNPKKIILPSKTPSGNLKYEVENISQIYLKAFKYYANEIFNLKLQDFNDKYDYLFIENIDIVEKVIKIIQSNVECFKKQYLNNLNELLEFAVFESFNISVENKYMYSNEQKNKLSNKLLSLKKNIYSKKLIIKKKTAGGAKPNLSKKILNQFGESILKYANFIKQLQDNNLMGQFRKDEKYKEKYILLKKYYEKATEKSKQLNKFKNIGEYLDKENYKKLAVALFIAENNIDILANTLYARVLRIYNWLNAIIIVNFLIIYKNILF